MEMRHATEFYPQLACTVYMIISDELFDIYFAGVEIY
jgi:hypothetical protein